MGKSFYFGPEYIDPSRFASYAYQLSEVLKLEPESVLEIGIGNGLVCYMLRKAGIDVSTLDFDESLEPDVVASVTDMPVPDNSFDVVACFQVLEHLPFATLGKALREIHRVTRKHVVISLPQRSRFYKLDCTLPKIGRRRVSVSLPLLTQARHTMDYEHYWEIGAKGCPLHRVTELLRSSGFRVRGTYRVWENPYHRMFILAKTEPSRGNRPDG